MILKKVVIHDQYGSHDDPPAKTTFYFCGIPLYTKQVGFKADAYNPQHPLNVKKR